MSTAVPGRTFSLFCFLIAIQDCLRLTAVGFSGAESCRRSGEAAPAGTAVELTLRARGRGLELMVKNQGAPIPPQELEKHNREIERRLFDVFRKYAGQRG